ncbi:hypothetical protein B0H16DRAFT_1470915 [Mycena metata]|uniref:Uncharacterized protein n=1 Tax=Mycena metata TaxID=1033252 RepID=A0AAD7MQH5_9AGAR|nr:hypothetical protein B0H16DRAFT_1470915 [Mycena metata]
MAAQRIHLRTARRCGRKELEEIGKWNLDVVLADPGPPRLRKALGRWRQSAKEIGKFHVNQAENQENNTRPCMECTKGLQADVRYFGAAALTPRVFELTPTESFSVNVDAELEDAYIGQFDFHGKPGNKTCSLTKKGIRLTEDEGTAEVEYDGHGRTQKVMSPSVENLEMPVGVIASPVF